MPEPEKWIYYLEINLHNNKVFHNSVKLFVSDLDYKQISNWEKLYAFSCYQESWTN